MLRKGFPAELRWALPFAVCEFAIVTHGFSRFGTNLAPLDFAAELSHVLIGANLTIAVFAGNFSLFAVNVSPYRAALRTLGPSIIEPAAATLLVASAPILVAAFAPVWVPTAAIIALPVTSYLAVILSFLSRRRASAVPHLSYLFKDRSLVDFRKKFLAQAKKLEEKRPDVVTYGIPAPTHEIGWRIRPTSILPDPFHESATIAGLASDAGDLHTYAFAVIGLLGAVRQVHQDAYRIAKAGDSVGTELLRHHAYETLSRVASLEPTWDRAGILPSRFTHICAAFLTDGDFGAHPGSELAVNVVAAMKRSSAPIISEGNTEPAITTVIVARRLALAGLDEAPHGSSDIERMLHEQRVPEYARIMMAVGEAAIPAGEVHLLYRCLDALGFLGCVAAKRDVHELGTACLLGLVQLGRAARKVKLPCFWDRCGLMPEDHALERIAWMASWTPTLNEGRRDAWGRSLTDALSRLNGTHTTVRYVEQDGRWKYTLVNSSEPYRYRIDDNGRIREYDFSDPDTLRELCIY